MNHEIHIKNLLAVRARILEEMKVYANKRSISHEMKCANARDRREEMRSIDVALLAAFDYDVNVSGYEA